MGHGYSSRVYLLQNYGLTSFAFSENEPPSYIVGLAYYQLAGRNINVIVAATIPNNTALIITLYRAYYPNATINISGPGREKIKLIIWALRYYEIYFSSNVVHKHVSYAGYTKDAVNKVAQNEFGKNANTTYAKYTSPADISIFYYGKLYLPE